MRYRYWIAFGASMALAVVFITAGVGKLLGQGAFLLQISETYKVGGALSEWLAVGLPWVEIGLGVVLLVGIVPQIAGGVATLLAGAFTMHNGWLIANGFGSEPCECLGVLDRIIGDMSTTASLYVDIGLVVLALAIYFCYPGRLLNTRPWLVGWKEITGGSS